ncbi:MAG TPA: ribonuclease domain-containing protein [Arthrobacter sp.]|nr:ribonuclease domain-containing protein [Arthrobacter sp.]
MTTKRVTTLLGALLGLALLVLVLSGIPRTAGAPDSIPSGASSSSPTAAPAGPSAGARPPTTGVANPSRLPEVKASDLPAEARQTLDLISRGGPYPYSRDNVPFGNFERLLPQKASGYYREFTVRTPGESDRGARRIIAGNAGEKYYTADHYASFSFIAEGK